MKAEIRLITIEDVKNFYENVVKKDSNIILHKGAHEFDANSIMSFFTSLVIDFNDPIVVEYNPSYDALISQFKTSNN